MLSPWPPLQPSRQWGHFHPHGCAKEVTLIQTRDRSRPPWPLVDTGCRGGLCPQLVTPAPTRSLCSQEPCSTVCLIGGHGCAEGSDPFSCFLFLFGVLPGSPLIVRGFLVCVFSAEGLLRLSLALQLSQGWPGLLVCGSISPVSLQLRLNPGFAFSRLLI